MWAVIKRIIITRYFINLKYLQLLPFIQTILHLNPKLSWCPFKSTIRLLDPSMILNNSNILNHIKPILLFNQMAIPARLERAAHRLEVCCSIQLSYGTKLSISIYSSRGTKYLHIRNFCIPKNMDHR